MLPAPVEIDNDQPSVRLDGMPQLREHFSRIIQMMIRVEDQREIQRRRLQLWIFLGSQDWCHVLPAMLRDLLPDRFHEIGVDIFGEHVAGFSGRGDQIGEQISYACADIGDHITPPNSQ